MSSVGSFESLDELPKKSASTSVLDEDIDISDSESINSLRSRSHSFNMGYENLSVFDLFDPYALTTDFSRKVKLNTATLKKFTKKQRDKLKARDEDFNRLKGQLLKRLDKFNDRVTHITTTSKTEKLFYSFALLQIFICGVLIGEYQQWFHVYYSVLFLCLMPVRFSTYYKRGYQYFLADLCYYVNILCLIFIWIFPESQMLFISCFSFAFGTLSFAVITWRNSLVLHSIEKTTSSMIHITPPLTMYVIVHQIDPEYQLARFPGAAKTASWNFYKGILYTSLFYLVWQSLYHYFITIKRAEKIKQGRATSFEYLRKAYSGNALGKAVNSLPEPFPVVAFTLIQFGYQLLTMSLCPLWFRYKLLCTLFMAFIFIAASYNGATYYVDYYGKKFEKEVITLRQELTQLQAKKED
ncbi:BA75_01961T0 [Komagataella pastoris]|uniref:Glycerophosphocholine acyltransferase 1 n=1 Tax=Komagataella pastoris TaxID=4922 RepID=A0A1B2JDS9_PICPA|nr:BA75_01961T0 [Komagataella pastoris]